MTDTITGTPIAAMVFSAANFNVSYQYGGFAMMVGPSQPVVDKSNAIIGTTAQWVASLQWSPEGVVQLHALLGQLLEDYERQFGVIPRPAVLFTRNGAAPGSGNNEADKVVDMFGRGVPEAATKPGDPPPPMRYQFGDTPCPDCGQIGAHYCKGLTVNTPAAPASGWEPNRPYVPAAPVDPPVETQPNYCSNCKSLVDCPCTNPVCPMH